MSTAKAKLLLILLFIARGTSFLFSKNLLLDMTPMGILAVRFLLAFLILALLYHRKMSACGKVDLHGGLILGFLYFLCMTFEMYGLQTIDTGVSALIENMAIILVPVYAAVLTRTPPRRKTMLCALLAVTGVGFLSVTQMERRGTTLGLILIILAALTYDVCIMATETVSREGDPVTIGILQLGVMGGLSLAAAFFTGSFCLPGSARDWGMMLLLVLLCSCFGFAFQPMAQKYVPAETAAVFTVVNPLTASILGFAAAGESMSPAKAVGYVLILLSLILYNT